MYTTYAHFAALRRPPEERARFRAARQHHGCRLLCKILGVRVSVEGAPPTGEGALMVCNHFGVLDPLVLASQMPLAFVAKAGIRKWPFVGWVTATMGVIFVHRDRRTATRSFIEQVRGRLQSGVNVLVFPEGTTTRDRTVRPFKTGTFAAVAGGDSVIYPLYLDAVAVEGRPAEGAVRDQVVWSDGPSFLRHFWHLLSLRHVDMVVRVGDAIPIGGAGRKVLAERLHSQVSELGAIPAGSVRSTVSGT